MSLHRQSQFQRAHRQEMADSCRSPLLLSGDICPYLLATGWFVAFGAAPRPVNRPLSPSPIRVNNLFAILFQKLFAAPERALSRPRRWERNPGIQGFCRKQGKCRGVRWAAARARRRLAGSWFFARIGHRISIPPGFHRSGSLKFGLRRRSKVRLLPERPLAVADSHAPCVLIRSIGSQIWPTRASMPTFARQSRRFDSSGHHLR